MTHAEEFACKRQHQDHLRLELPHVQDSATFPKLSTLPLDHLRNAPLQCSGSVLPASSTAYEGAALVAAVFSSPKILQINLALWNIVH